MRVEGRRVGGSGGSHGWGRWVEEWGEINGVNVDRKCGV